MISIIETSSLSFGIFSLITPRLQTYAALVNLLLFNALCNLDGRLTATFKPPASLTTILPPTSTVLYQPDPGVPWFALLLVSVTVLATMVVLIKLVWNGTGPPSPPCSLASDAIDIREVADAQSQVHMVLVDTPSPLLPVSPPPSPLPTIASVTSISSEEWYTTPTPSPRGSSSLLRTVEPDEDYFYLPSLRTSSSFSSDDASEHYTTALFEPSSPQYISPRGSSSPLRTVEPDEDHLYLPSLRTSSSFNSDDESEHDTMPLSEPLSPQHIMSLLPFAEGDGESSHLAADLTVPSLAAGSEGSPRNGYMALLDVRRAVIDWTEAVEDADVDTDVEEQEGEASLSTVEHHGSIADPGHEEAAEGDTTYVESDVLGMSMMLVGLLDEIEEEEPVMWGVEDITMGGSIEGTGEVVADEMDVEYWLLFDADLDAEAQEPPQNDEATPVGLVRNVVEDIETPLEDVHEEVEEAMQVNIIGQEPEMLANQSIVEDNPSSSISISASTSNDSFSLTLPEAFANDLLVHAEAPLGNVLLDDDEEGGDNVLYVMPDPSTAALEVDDESFADFFTTGTTYGPEWNATEWMSVLQNDLDGTDTNNSEADVLVATMVAATSELTETSVNSPARPQTPPPSLDARTKVESPLGRPSTSELPPMTPVRQPYPPGLNIISPSPPTVRMMTPPPGTHSFPAFLDSIPSLLPSPPSSPSPAPSRRAYDPGDPDTSLDMDDILLACEGYENLMDAVDDWPTEPDVAEDWENTPASLANLEEMRKQLEKISKKIDISGGEKQRLVASRTFMHLNSGKVKFVAVDEPSSALDTEGEAQLFDRLIAARAGMI
ncbi:hypothetical protein FPV67DRAFT_1671664 [Lyophyllum atratum]|nr:hypothetical protein FPV67DRAFT_1671664 [Lyophyllum atratum]